MLHGQIDPTREARRASKDLTCFTRTDPRGVLADWCRAATASWRRTRHEPDVLRQGLVELLRQARKDGRRRCWFDKVRMKACAPRAVFVGRLPVTCQRDQA